MSSASLSAEKVQQSQFDASAAAKTATDKATSAKQKALTLKNQAQRAADPKERARMLQEAYDHEVLAHGQSKAARRLQSGAWQGAAGGAGIGGGVAMGLGTAVGTLVGGVVSIPTVAVGGLTGAAVGGLHGPWFELDRKGALERREQREKEKANERGDEEAALRHEKMQGGIREEILEAQEQAMSQDVEEARRNAADAAKVAGVRKKPRKLQVRSDGNGGGSVKSTPRKLELRSGASKA